MNRLLRCLPFIATFVGLCTAAYAGQYRLAGVQADHSPIGHSASTAGYKIRVCVSPAADRSSKNPAQYKIQIGILDDSQPRQNAVQTWALYE